MLTRSVQVMIFTMKFNLFISLLAWLSVFSVATPTKDTLGGNSITKRTPLWQFYYDVTSAQHQAIPDNLSECIRPTSQPSLCSSLGSTSRTLILCHPRSIRLRISNFLRYPLRSRLCIYDHHRHGPRLQRHLCRCNGAEWCNKLVQDFSC
jgi:hypothetical protein